MRVEDGTGNGYSQRVDKRNFAHTFGVTETEQEDSTRQGLAFNINSGLVSISTGSAARQGLLYVYNDEDEDLIINAAIGFIGTRTATITDLPNFWIVRNPTGGDTVTNAVAADMGGINSNFGSNNTLKSTTLTYKGADGDSAFTGGTDYALLGATEGRNAYPELNIELPRGASIGLEVDGNTSGAFTTYMALVSYERDPDLGNG